MHKLHLLPENTYLLPFDESTRHLSLATLNERSTHRRPSSPYLYVGRRIISYQNEILTIGTTIGRDGEEEKVYLKTSRNHLQVSCSIDTTSTYLSYHAYCCLEGMMSYDKIADFEKYYWPDFFHPKTGKSKFLTIINDRMGLDITLKACYKQFYKPDEFSFPEIQPQSLPLGYEVVGEKEHVVLEDEVFSFFVTKRFQLFKQSISLPFLLAYEGLLKKDKSNVKQYKISIIDGGDAVTCLNSAQQQLMTYVAEMLPFDKVTLEVNFGLASTALNEKLGQLFEIWQKVWPLLAKQQFVKCYLLGRTENYKNKPYRNWISNIKASLIVPQLCVICTTRKDYLEISLGVKVLGKWHAVVHADYLFFVEDEHHNFYLLGSLQDVALVQWFKTYNFCFSVMKCHYEDELLPFIKLLEDVYEVRYKRR